MSLLNRRVLWLRPGVAMAMMLAATAPGLASPEIGSPAKTEGLPAIAAAAGPEASTQSSKSENKTSSVAPGEVKVDEEAAQRALERTLVVQGALLLPFGQAEFQPSFSYSRYEADDLNQLVIQQGTGTPFLIENKAKSNVLTADLFFRFGLPFDSQIEFGIPYRFISSEEVVDVSGGGSGHSTVSSDNSGFGDFRLGLAKALLREGPWWPNLIGRVTWDSDSGDSDFGEINPNNSLGSGFNELTGSVTAAKRQDPLVFLGSVFYTTSFEEHHIKPGDELGFSIGALLAASPATSLRVILNQTFANELEFDGKTVDGSDQTIASLSFGASSIIGHGKFLDFSVSAGLTDQAPEYSVGVTFVIRFDVPGVSL